MLLSQSVKIEKYIASLLRDFDCVIIPGLGGFVANYSPSQFHAAKGLLSPPSKAIIFNRNLINNDGLLVNHLATEEQLTYSDAMGQVNSFVTDCKKELAIGKRIEFEELGVLYEDNERNLQFRPDFSVNFLTESFGLYPVVAKELVHSVKAIEAVQPVAENTSASLTARKEIVLPKIEKTEIKESEKIERVLKPEIRVVESQQVEEKKIVPIRKRNKTGRYIAIAAITIPFIFYSVWIPLKTDVMKTGVIEVADLNPFRTPAPSSVYQPEENKIENLFSGEIMPTFEESAAEEPIFSIPETNEIDSTLVDQPNTINPDINTSGNYHIIAGCFQEDENAQRMVEYLNAKGYKAYVLDTVNGLKRVTAASYSNVGEAIAALRDLRNSQISEAWLLTVR